MLQQKISLKADRAIKAILLVLAFSLQIQVTLFKSAEYNGLRVNVTDLLLPFIGLYILFSLLSKQTRWPDWSIKGAYFWLVGLGLILTAALLNSYYSFGKLSLWGLQNKIIGWGVLSALFLMGGWLGTNAKRDYIPLFFKILGGFLVLIMLIQIGFQVSFFTFSYRPINNQFTNYPMEVLMANKNAFVFLFLCMLAFLTTLSPHDKIILRLSYVFWFLLPIIFLHTGARSAFIALPFLLTALAFSGQKIQWRKTITLLVISVLLCGVVTSLSNIKIYTFRTHTIESITQINAVIKGQALDKVAEDVAYHGDSNRLNILHHVFGMIKENPIFGSGLGSVMMSQIRESGSYIDLMDCTALWLIAETGFIGFGFFFIFYALCFVAIWKKYKHPDASEFTKAFCAGTILMLLIFTIMSLFHELLYTRFLWVFLGIALTLPIKKSA